MACLNVNPYALDQLDQLSGFTEFFEKVFTGIGKTGAWVATNQQAVVNILDAAGRLRNQGAATGKAVQAAYQQNLTGKAIPVQTSPYEWQAMQERSPYETPIPSWVMPVALGAGALVLVLLLTRGRGGGNG